MKTLKSMREFCLANSNKNSIEYKEAVFQSQQPNIGMFVPAVFEDGVWRVLEEPIDCDGIKCELNGCMTDICTGIYKTEYQQAQSKVIFKGFNLVGDGFDFDKTVFEIENDLYFIEFIGNEITLTINAIDQDIDIHTLEDLVKFNLEMV